MVAVQFQFQWLIVAGEFDYDYDYLRWVLILVGLLLLMSLFRMSKNSIATHRTRLRSSILIDFTT